MKIRKTFLIVFAAAVLASGQAYWTVPYDDMSLLDRAFLLRWALPGAVMAVLARRFLPVGRGSLVGVFALGYAGAAAGRILIDAIADPTGHNLWPLELVISIFVGAVSSLPGAVTPSGSSTARTENN